MRRAFGIGLAILAILVAVAIGVGAYDAGVTDGLEQARRGVEVVRVVGHGGGFPFGLILFPLLFFGLFALFRGAMWRGRWGGPGPWHHGPYGKGGAGTFEEWHRRQHEEGGAGGAGSSGTEPSSA